MIPGGLTPADVIVAWKAGASALGIGAELLPVEAFQFREQTWIHELARRFTGMVQDARAQMKNLRDD